MSSPSKDAKAEFVQLIRFSIKESYPNTQISEEEILLSIAEPRQEHGDLSSSISFKISKSEKKSPKEIAETLASKFREGYLIKKPSSINGYLNAFIDEIAYAKLVISAIWKEGDDYGKSDLGDGKRIIVESPSVNPNKPWLVSHLKNALLGDAISNALSSCGYSVERINYIDDLGLQVAESLWGFKNLNNKPDKKFDLWLGEQYVKVNAEITKEKSIEENVKLLNKLMEEDTLEAKEARQLAERCVVAQYETSFSYKIYHDLLIWESDILRSKLLEKALSVLKEKGITEVPSDGKFAGCTVINLEKAKNISKEFENPEEKIKVLVRSNGVATYVAKDLAFDMWKFGIIDVDFQYKWFMKEPNGAELYTTSSEGTAMTFGKAEKIVNIIGSSQRFPQMILKAILELMGREDLSKSRIHIPYGEIGIEEGTLSGRKGGWLGDERNYTADDLLAEAKLRSLEIINKNEKFSGKGNKDEIAEAVSLGAIKLEYLRTDPEKKVTFSWDKALSFEGNSGPYCMYTYARASRILEKASYDGKISENDYSQVKREEDFELLKALGEFGDILEKACNEYRPNIIVDYALRTAHQFSKFYEKMPVIKGGDAKEVRLALVEAARQVMHNALAVIGINTIEIM